MDPQPTNPLLTTRRHFFGTTRLGLGALAFSTLANTTRAAAAATKSTVPVAGLPGLPHFSAKAKRVIYLFQSGGPSQIDLFDYKPQLQKLNTTELPDSVRRGQRLTGMTSRQASFPIAASKYKFAQHGDSGAWVSELLPHTAKVADRLCFVKSLFTEAINHDPAITFFQTGAQLSGRPSIGSWLSYGLGTENQDLPAFVALVSNGTGNPMDQPLYDRLWGSGFLPTKYQGIKFRSSGDPVLYLSNPPGMDDGTRRQELDDLSRLNNLELNKYADPEIATRIAQYELAYRMQSSVPELTNVAEEPAHVFDMYGPARVLPARSPRTACSPVGYRNAVFDSSSFSTAAGINIRNCLSNSPANATIPTNPRPRWSRTLSSAGCSMKRWWCGAANSDAPSTARAN